MHQEHAKRTFLNTRLAHGIHTEQVGMGFFFFYYCLLAHGGRGSIWNVEVLQISLSFLQAFSFTVLFGYVKDSVS